MVIDEMAIWMRLDCTAGNRPLKGIFSMRTDLPTRRATSLTRSISKPTYWPWAFWNSQGTLPILAPTVQPAAAVVAAAIAGGCVNPPSAAANPMQDKRTSSFTREA
jgi:hypothetical protein